LARSSTPDPVSARALVLTPLAARGTSLKVEVTLLIVLPDGTTTVGHSFLDHSQQFNGVIRPGTWVPVTVVPDDPDAAQLDGHHSPTARNVADVIAEALGGPAADLPPPLDQWRIGLALGYAEEVIAAGAITPSQAEVIRQRISRGV
jgi:hypothetical protein